MVKFEWNEAKERSNRRKHGISFKEAQSVFFDEYALQFFDEDHSVEENRFIMLGMSIRSRILVVIHCEIDANTTIRIISARKATVTERKVYKGPKL
jgi:uncharacterized DUF497 family protein